MRKREGEGSESGSSHKQTASELVSVRWSFGWGGLSIFDAIGADVFIVYALVTSAITLSHGNQPSFPLGSGFHALTNKVGAIDANGHDR